MKRNELEKLEKISYDEEIPLLDELYIVVSNRKHDSGYNMYKVYGVAYGYNRKITYAKYLSEISDEKRKQKIKRILSNGLFPSFWLSCLLPPASPPFLRTKG